MTPPPDFEALLEHRKAFQAFLERRLPDPAVAEDILQQGLAKAAVSEGPNDPDRLLPWFYQVLRHAVIDFYRARAAEARKHEAFLREVEAGGWPDAAAAETERSVCRCFENLIPALRPEYGELIRRVDLGGESPGAVAAEKGETANNVSVRLHRARRALREELSRCCGACATHGCLDCDCAHEKTGKAA